MKKIFDMARSMDMPNLIYFLRDAFPKDAIVEIHSDPHSDGLVIRPLPPETKKDWWVKKMLKGLSKDVHFAQHGITVFCYMDTKKESRTGHYTAAQPHDFDLEVGKAIAWARLSYQDIPDYVFDK